MASQFVQLPAGAGGGGGSGTVTSVDMTVPTGFTISGNPITSNGTLQLGLSAEVKNTIWAGPTTGADAAPTFRVLVGADLPALTSAHLFVGNGSNVATDVAITGDVLFSNAGVTSIATGVIVNTDVNASAAIAVSKLAALTASRAVASDASGFLVSATTTATELGYVNGVTSAIQTQINSKQASGNYITALTGDVTASGPGSVAATLAATSNATLTTLSALTSAAALATVGTIGTGVWQGTPVVVTYGGTGRATLTNHGVLIGAGTSAVTQLAAAAAGTVLAGVASSDPAFTATPSLISAGTVTADTNFLTITNSGNAASMTDTRSSIKFNQFYYDASTPAIKDSGELVIGTEGNWTSTASTQKSYLAFSTMNVGTLTEVGRMNSSGAMLIGTASGSLTGPGSLCVGTNVRVTSNNAIAFGISSSASSQATIAVGDTCSAAALWSQAFGYTCTTNGTFSTAQGARLVTDHSGTIIQGDSSPDSGSSIHTGAADTFYSRFKGGWEYYKNGNPASPSGVRKIVQMATLNTTDNTKTTILTYATASNVSYGFSANITARRTGGSSGSAGDSAYYTLQAGAKNVAGTVTVATPVLTVINEDNANLTATIEASSTNVIIEVTGDTNNNYTWNCTVDIYPV